MTKISSMNKPIPGSVLCGVACLGIAIVVLMQLGIEWHGNYEYYVRYPALYLIPGLIGFVGVSNAEAGKRRLPPLWRMG
jgi:hypothetical protein